ncbi:MAG: NRDE family protein [Leptospiraceae bacterium]|nr:NRDE family protein [Leptospiraceae bacterium]MDW7976769.1 NRDE family protein [Leptospiraceae bacterium]
MCTLTIFSYEKDRSFLIAFNRDELKIRKIAYPPSFYEFRGIKQLYPKDAESGGTWIGINDLGFAFVLLNYNQKGLYKNYATNPVYLNKKSRGFIIPPLLEFSTETEILQAMKTLPYEQFSPFRLIFFNPHKQKIHALIYTGRGKKYREYCLPFFQASSGIGDLKMYPIRKRLFKEFLKNPTSSKQQIRFHHYYNKKKPSNGILMNRKLAHTVSQSFILLKEKKVYFHYKDVIQKKKYKYQMTLKTPIAL